MEQPRSDHISASSYGYHDFSDNDNEEIGDEDDDHVRKRKENGEIIDKNEGNATKKLKLLEGTSTHQSYTIDDIRKDLDDNTRVWSDFLRPHLHPRSLIEVPFVQDVDAFDVFTQGFETFQRETMSDEVVNGFHRLIEACDRPQGFQILSDQHNAWGSCADATIDLIKDEIGAKYSIVTLTSSPYIVNFETPTQQYNHILNSCLSFVRLYDQSSLLIPTTAQHLTSPYRSQYRTSSLVASAFDTATYGLRCKDELNLDTWCRKIALSSSFKLSSLGLSLPLPLKGERKIDHDGYSLSDPHIYVHIENDILKYVFTSMDPIHRSNLITCLTPLVTPNVSSIKYYYFNYSTLHH